MMVKTHKEKPSIKAGKRAAVGQRYLSYAPNLSSANRKLGKSESRKKILIVCEGERTEPNYFKWLKNIWRVNAEVEIIGNCGDPLNVVERAKQEKAKRKRDTRFDFVFAVFDRDDFSQDRINRAYELAESCGISLDFSNEAFELWYLLHFEYLDTALSRRDLCIKLRRVTGRPYLKNDTGIFKILFSNIMNAVKNAMILERYNGITRKNPYTSVHRLIKELAQAAAEAPDIKDATRDILKLFDNSR